MTKQKHPEGFWRIQDIMAQTKLSRMRVGAHNQLYQCRDDDSKPDEPKWVKGEGLKWEVGLMFTPNFGNKQIKFIIALSSDDTYTLFVTQGRHLRHEFRNLYNDNVGEVVESVYDDIIRSDFGGFIPI